MFSSDQMCQTIFKPSCWKPVAPGEETSSGYSSNVLTQAFHNKGVLSSSLTELF